MVVEINPTLLSIRDQVEDLIEARNAAGLSAVLDAIHPADIADLLEILDDAGRVEVFSSLPPAVAAEVLDETRTEITQILVEAISNEKIADLLEVLPMDDAAEILDELEDEQAAEIIALMQPEDAAEVSQLLAYPEDSAGRLMTTKVVTLDETWTIAQTLEHLRGVDTEIETLAYLYVVNPAGYLVGLVRLRDLVTAMPGRQLADLVQTDILSVTVDTDQERVARMVSQYDYFAIPVVDETGYFKGIITHDDVMDILEEEFTEDVQRFGGSQPLDGTYFSTPILTMVGKRVGWLLLLFLTATLTTSVMGLYEEEIRAVVALSLFIPLLIGTGGNAGSQMTATMIRALAVDEVRFSDTWRVVFREVGTGLLLGAIMAAIGFLASLLWTKSVSLAATVAASLVVLVVWSNLMGSLLPIIASRLKVDPTVISGPVMSTLVDATGLLIYFTLARVIMGI
jgi:magnesium transporter